MDALVVGALTAVTVTLGTLFWHLLVKPDVLLSLWQGSEEGSDWFDHHPGALAALRWVAGAVVFLLGFLTGLATVFLVRTSGGP